MGAADTGRLNRCSQHRICSWWFATRKCLGKPGLGVFVFAYLFFCLFVYFTALASPSSKTLAGIADRDGVLRTKTLQAKEEWLTEFLMVWFLSEAWYSLALLSMLLFHQLWGKTTKETVCCLMWPRYDLYWWPCPHSNKILYKLINILEIRVSQKTREARGGGPQNVRNGRGERIGVNVLAWEGGFQHWL